MEIKLEGIFFKCKECCFNDVLGIKIEKDVALIPESVKTVGNTTEIKYKCSLGTSCKNFGCGHH